MRFRNGKFCLGVIVFLDVGSLSLSFLRGGGCSVVMVLAGWFPSCVVLRRYSFVFSAGGLLKGVFDESEAL